MEQKIKQLIQKAESEPNLSKQNKLIFQILKLMLEKL
jgi:hypothetical protein